MLGLRRVVGLNSRVAVAARSYRVSALRAGGAHKDAHDDHEHHDHAMFEELPFKRSTILPMTLGIVFGGVGLICFGVVFQNKKHGFYDRKE